MERQPPVAPADEIDLYVRTYSSLLRSTGDVDVRAFEEAHAYSASSLHEGAVMLEPDVSAFAYAAGRLPLAILLFLPAGLSSSDQGCLNQPGGVQAQTFFAQDVPRVLQTAAAASSSASQWALLGDQSGGYCALQLALDDSGVFSVAAAPPASYARPPGPGAAGSPQLSQQDDLLWQLRHLPPQPLSVLVAGPGAAPGLGPARELAALARPPMHVASASLAPGRWPLTPVLDWIGAVLRAPAPLTAGPR